MPCRKAIEAGRTAVDAAALTDDGNMAAVVINSGRQAVWAACAFHDGTGLPEKMPCPRTRRPYPPPEHRSRPGLALGGHGSDRALACLLMLLNRLNVRRDVAGVHGSLRGVGLGKNRVRLSGGTAWQTDFRRRTTGRALRSPMEIATVRRMLNHTLTELKRAIDNYAVAEAVDLYALAWQQAAGAPPSETREHRALLQSYKEILGSRRWRKKERLQRRLHRRR
ncbi:hypothetical protein [Streptomyces sp. HC307]|uniref:hypothetical protein n=1 Tax=Streptomyces flavusporus TaxID=3385496 RepID=UPI0039175084